MSPSTSLHPPATSGNEPPREISGQSPQDNGSPTGDTQTPGPATAMGEPGNNTSGGNNTRSFRFLLTLALRKAQTAVTLDNGGHVEEAIRTYREAISMLGLVLNRTNEEDGRQRLLHFRQTYSDRVAVLSSLRPAQPGDASTNAAHPQAQPQQHQSNSAESQQKQMDSAAQKDTPGSDGHGEKSGAENNPQASPKPKASVVVASQTEKALPANSDSKSETMASQDAPPTSTAPTSQKKPKLVLNVTEALKTELPLQLDNPEPATSIPQKQAARLKTKSSRQAPPLSPIILNKPLPPLVGEDISPLSLKNTEELPASKSSPRTTPGDASDTLATGPQQSNIPDRADSPSKTSPRSSPKGSPKSSAKNGTKASSPGSPKQPTRSPQTVQPEPVAKDAARSDSPAKPADSPSSKSKKKDTDKDKEKEKDKEKDVDKASRRQSIKSQRSLPAMFGIGLKGKSDKQVPPVPQLPANENTTSNIGRRLFGTRRNNSSNTLTSDSADFTDMPQIPEQAAEDLTTSSTAHPKHGGDSADYVQDMSYFSNSVITTSIEDIVMIDRSPYNPQDVNSFEIPPPTPLKDGFQHHHQGLKSSAQSYMSTGSDDVASINTTLEQQAPSSVSTLTREQKRQSKAAHRLVGLFKRNQSIPEIPSPSLSQKTSSDAPKAALSLAQPPVPPATLSLKDRRLSSSASTPNLIEVAAAAASNDQPSLAVNAAAERGDIPPMPAPPTLRPSVSSATTSYTAMSSESTSTGAGTGAGEESRLGSLFSSRGGRGSSLNDAMTASVGGGIMRMEEHRQKPAQQQQQQHTMRPTLRIATKSAAEVLTYAPEYSVPLSAVPMATVPMTAGIENTMRGRKSSVAAVGSQSVTRGNVGLAAGILGNITNTINGNQAANPAYGRPTLADVEEDQRLEMFEPSFGTFHTDLGPAPPKTSPLSSLWLINTLHRSMVTGGAYMTTSLYIPRRLWFQTGIRIVAIETKLGVLTQLSQSFSTINSLISLPDIDALFASNIPPRQEDSRLETTPWETDESHLRNNAEKDSLQRSCVALHHWLNNLEDILENNRRVLGKKLKFINPTANVGAPVAGTPGGASVNPLAAASNDNLQSSLTHLPLNSVASNSHDGSNLSSAVNTSFPNLTLSNGDLANGTGPAAPISPLSPAAELASDPRISDLRIAETPTSLVFSGIGGGGSSMLNMSRDQLSKDQMSNSRFKSFGKLGKSVDRLYSNIQKEKLDDTTTYVAALQRLFELLMVLEDLMHYFSRVASDSDMSGWFTEVPQSPVSLVGKRHQHRAHGESISRNAGSPPIAHAALATEPLSSLAHMAAERKNSNASIPHNTSAVGVATTPGSTTTGGFASATAAAAAAAAAADKKNRRRSNYFGQRQNSSNFADTTEAMPVMKVATKPRTDSFSSIPRVVPILANTAGSINGGVTSSISGANGRFVLPQSPIKNPASYVQQGMGRAPGVIYARLVKVAEWLNQVLLAWVVRDLQVLYAKYIKRLREWVVE
ncbi:hypothetical protein GGI07_000880 [Coemansia sp. Benny D115]|nr:hypothetical protein GGI07_000880 [Coemansia sp. Benny D115]